MASDRARERLRGMSARAFVHTSCGDIVDERGEEHE